jgi:hypothetical protein
MKHLYLFIFICSFFTLPAQVADYSVTDCSGNSQSIYQVLGTGKALIVASKGFDCSICVSRAGGWGTWAGSNPNVQVWGAMTLTYSSSTPTCSQLNNWVNNHSWSSIYTFIDSNEFFFSAGTPRYIVYSPVDSTIIYTGGSESQARSAALNASNSISLPENSLESLQFYYANGSLHFRKVPSGNTLVEIYNLTGKKERVLTLRKDRKDFSISDLPKGIYLMRLSNQSAAVTRKIVIS